MTGKMKEYMSETDSGSTATRGFCPDCGGRLTFRSTSMPGMVLLLAGSLDDPSLIMPTVTVFHR